MLRTRGTRTDSGSALPLVATPPAQPTANILDIETEDLAIRKPSHLISKNQSGRLNGRGLRPSGIVWKCGRGTEISIANPVLAAQAPAVAPRDSMN
jgi:hypothetical protein